MQPQIYLHNFSDVLLKYEIPEHLQDVKDIEEQRKADLEFLDTELKMRGSGLEEKLSSKVIWRQDFPGMVLDVQRIHFNGYIELTLKPIHPHRADLAYKKDETLRRNVFPLTVNALLESAEGSFPLGIRGGSVETGKIAIIPGGHVDYTIPEIENALETFRNEFDEELGYKFDGQVLPVCVFNNGDTNGINVLYKAKTNLSFFEIVEKWKAAKDRGEHDSLVQAYYPEIRQLAETGKTTIKGEEYFTTPLFQDCFRIILEKDS